MANGALPTQPAVSLVVVGYDMARELPRTLETIATQHDISPHDVEVIVVDNGSPEPIESSALACVPSGRLLSVPDAPASPVLAANLGLDAANAPLIGMFIDGARMLSPGLVAGAVRAGRLAARPIVATLAFHLGRELQMAAVAKGYDQDAEDELLATVDWRHDGYELFGISVLAASSSRGWFGPMGESNALFLTRELWDELGGLDPAFGAPGGGLANHDLYRRACGLAGTELYVLLGEGTFHQFHGGAATGGAGGDAARAEYERIRGYPYAPPAAAATLVGRVPSQAHRHLAQSVAWLEGR